MTTSTVLTELLAERGVLLVDGATGTQLMAAGLEAGDAPERLNLDHPETVHGLHESYVNAGSDIVLTNTFGGSRLRLKLHKLDDRVIEINRKAARHARHVVDQLERRVLVAGSMGPTGELLAPLGALGPRDALLPPDGLRLAAVHRPYFELTSDRATPPHSPFPSPHRPTTGTSTIRTSPESSTPTRSSR